jgi:recombinational DNA repair ATPase RecF
MTTTENNNINNQRYLEICNEFNDIMKEKNKEIKKVKEKYNKVYEKMIIVYGIIKLLKNELDFNGDFELEAIFYKIDTLLNDTILIDLFKINDD